MPGEISGALYTAVSIFSESIPRCTLLWNGGDVPIPCPEEFSLARTSATRAGVHRIVLNGSFTADIIEPNDVDCVLLFVAGQRRDRGAMKELRGGFPFLDMKLVGQKDFDEYVNVTPGTDRAGTLKGVVI